MGALARAVIGCEPVSAVLGLSAWDFYDTNRVPTSASDPGSTWDRRSSESYAPIGVPYKGRRAIAQIQNHQWTLSLSKKTVSRLNQLTVQAIQFR